VADIRSARPVADLVIVSLHWGYGTQGARKRGASLAHRLLDVRADLVVGHDSHVVQPVENYHQRSIVYGPRSFVFERKDLATRNGLMFKVMLRGKEIRDLTCSHQYEQELFRPSSLRSRNGTARPGYYLSALAKGKRIV
jgi:poly-gamma-glutamate capsule biosynthesis protein CapA/YwtB (metallophosphatase superfamily)